ncbi:hypothetical protein CLIB1444_07S00848 [[Candida] jaroonii]|uniref:Uncharacterized protein n=1 Tax=[Candida] jaroonii TaxID=467808 RepID=A0ACA9Y9I2_9ASCO|nr:hypothetical protein CLIB1444_07S00848 [[Candida] jaroonii]
MSDDDDESPLISETYNWDQPLSEIIRPKNLEDYIGQSHLLHKDGQISNFLRLKYLPSMILYGPPGVGKTTIASILATETNYVLVEMSATDATVGDLKKLSEIIKIENSKRYRDKKDYLSVVVFIDEIHRFTILQQDFLLPLIESGVFVFIGATTVRPNVRLRRAILSRCQVFQLLPLTKEELTQVVKKAVLFENIRRKSKGFVFLLYNNKTLDLLVDKCKGDSRRLINFIEVLSVNFQHSKFKASDPYSLTTDEVVEVLKNLIAIDRNFDSKETFRELFKAIENVRFKRFKNTKSRRQGVINDNNDNFYGNDSNYYLQPNDTNPKYAQQMEFSDNEFDDIPYTYNDKTQTTFRNLLSDTESDYESIEPTNSRFQIVKCLRFLLVLIHNQVPTEIIIRRLLLFELLYIWNDSSLFKIMGLLKSIRTTNVNISKSLSSLVDKLAKLKKRRFPLHKLRSAKKFLKSKNVRKGIITPEVSFDDDEVQRLLQAPKQTQIIDTPVQIDELDFNDADINIGLGDPDLLESSAQSSEVIEIDD